VLKIACASTGDVRATTAGSAPESDAAADESASGVLRTPNAPSSAEMCSRVVFSSHEMPTVLDCKGHACEG
jgi:hypothetical protein